MVSHPGLVGHWVQFAGSPRGRVGPRLNTVWFQCAPTRPHEAFQDFPEQPGVKVLWVPGPIVPTAGDTGARLAEDELLPGDMTSPCEAGSAGDLAELVAGQVREQDVRVHGGIDAIRGSAIHLRNGGARVYD